MRRKRLPHCAGSLLLFALLWGCTKNVAPEDVYRHKSSYAGQSIAENIQVEQTTEGMRISGTDRSVVFEPPTQYRFPLRIEPEDSSFRYQAEQILLDNVTGTFYSRAHVALGESSYVPAHLPVQGATGAVPKHCGFYPDALGSRGISVKIDDEIGHTTIAGLTFKDEVAINILEDGAVEVDREGVEASAMDGAEWGSRKVKYQGKTAVIMVRKT